MRLTCLRAGTHSQAQKLGLRLVAASLRLGEQKGMFVKDLTLIRYIYSPFFTRNLGPTERNALCPMLRVLRFAPGSLHHANKTVLTPLN